jgi:hypothetical protein
LPHVNEIAVAQKYRKIDPRVWRDERFLLLTSEEKLVALYCLTAQVNRCGIFVFSPAMAAEELGTSPQTFRERFRKVCQTLRWEWDDTRRVLYFPTWWKYNHPENTNVLKGNLSDLSDLPETPLLDRFYENTRYLSGNVTETFRECYPKPYPQPLAIQEQEQEQEQDKNMAAPAAEVVTEKKPSGSDLWFAEFWNAYPRKEKRADAHKAWKKINPNRELVDAILRAIDVQRRSDKWTSDGGKYIPHPTTWLNGRRWEDEVAVEVVQKSSVPQLNLENC